MIRDQLADALRAALVALGVDPLPETINLERPARREHGDWSSNVALATAKKAGRNPRELAQALADHLNGEAHRPAHVTAVEIAGPGFVNFRLADSWLHAVLTTVVTEGAGDVIVNPAGVWHTADVHEPGAILTVTPGRGTENRPR